MYDLDIIKAFYSNYSERVSSARMSLGRPLTLSEKIIYSHLYALGAPVPVVDVSGEVQASVSKAVCDRPSAIPAIRPLKRQQDYADFRPDRVAMQDATAQMAVLQFINSGKDKVSVPATIHCDHLICAHSGKEKDLPEALNTNAEVYNFLASAASRYGIGFWKPGAGIIHQIILENYAFPGGMMVGADSHTPNAGGLGMIAIGVGGADAVDVMAGMEWELKMPKIIGVRLTGTLRGWASPKDVSLKIAGMLTVKGGTNSIIEYFGPGAGTISCTGKATICNMGAEVGATCSIFPFDRHMVTYLKATGRGEVAELAAENHPNLVADDAVEAHPEQYFDTVLNINLSEIEPYVNGPFTPDAACPASGMMDRIQANGFPEKVEVSLIGSCTNSSYQDLARAASVARSAMNAGLKPKAQLIVNPGSERIKATAERDGILSTLRKAGAVIMTNACGPCIGQWKRETDDPQRRNSIVTSFNRNFAKRADGNPNTNAFIVSPEMAVALAFSGSLGFDPRRDSIDGVMLPEPAGDELPQKGFASYEEGYVAPQPDAPDVVIPANSDRLQKLQPFKAWDGKDFNGLALLIKTRGKCTTDHISMAGPWLKYRGHLENISENLLMGAVDAFSGQSGPVAARAKDFRDNGSGSIVVSEDNYGEGSSREHAAMECRFMGVKAVLAKSFARIHETNLKKQGVLALTFSDPGDYDKVRKDDSIDVCCSTIRPGSPVKIVLHHSDGSKESFNANHSYNAQQIAWFRAGSALNNLNKMKES